VKVIAAVGAWGGLGLCVALLVLLLRFNPIGFFGVGHRGQGIGLAVAILVLGFLLFAIYRAIPAMFDALRLAYDARGVRYESVSGYWPLGTADKGEAPWSAVFADDSRLLVGRKLIAHRNLLLGDLFEKEDLAPLLRALPPDHRVPPLRMTKLAWRAGALRDTLVGVAIGAIAGLALVVLKRTLL
jgi:hypothetical protein